MPLVLIQPHYFADKSDYFYTGCSVEWLQINAGSKAGMAR